MKSGTVFCYQDAYKFLEGNFPEECGQRGYQQGLPAYQRDAGFAIWDARLRHGLVRHTGVRGQRQRV